MEESALSILNRERRRLGLGWALEYGPRRMHTHPLSYKEVTSDIRAHDPEIRIDAAVDTETCQPITGPSVGEGRPLVMNNATIDFTINQLPGSRQFSTQASTGFDFSTLVTPYPPPNSSGLPEGALLGAVSPRTFYDLSALLYSNETDTTHILRAVSCWGQAEEDVPEVVIRNRLNIAARNSEIARKKDLIALELMKTDSLKVSAHSLFFFFFHTISFFHQAQPSWAKKWIYLVFIHDEHAYPTSFNAVEAPESNHFKALLNVISLLLTTDARDKRTAMAIVNQERKNRSLRWTLEFVSTEENLAALVRTGVKCSEVLSALSPCYKPHEALVHSSSLPKIFKIQRTSVTSSSPSGIKLRIPARALWPPPRSAFRHQPDQSYSYSPVDLTSKYSAMYRAIGRAEPGTSGKLHVWARTRPELCEAAPYFRSYQGGVYHSKESGLLGYLLYVCIPLPVPHSDLLLMNRDGYPAPWA